MYVSHYKNTVGCRLCPAKSTRYSAASPLKGGRNEWEGSDYFQLYNGDQETLVKSLEQIQRTTAEILEAIRNKESQAETASGESCVAVAA